MYDIPSTDCKITETLKKYTSKHLVEALMTQASITNHLLLLIYISDLFILGLSSLFLVSSTPALSLNLLTFDYKVDCSDFFQEN